jgi:hypothetical protein
MELKRSSREGLRELRRSSRSVETELKVKHGVRKEIKGAQEELKEDGTE